MLSHHLISQNTGQFSQGLQVGDVNYQRSEVIVQYQTQSLEELIQLTVITLKLVKLIRWRGEELCVQLILILTYMQ